MSETELQQLKWLACQLHREKRLNEAIVVYRAYLFRRPVDYQMWCNLGVALRAKQHFRAAVACYHRALEIQPDNPDYLSNLGNALKDMDRLDEALAAHRCALAVHAESCQYRYNYALALRDAGDHEQALVELDRCARMEPDNAPIQFDRGLVLLYLGRLKEGWKGYEWRFRTGEIPAPLFDGPFWRGEDIPGKCLLVFSEQGYGDAIWVSRFFPRLKAKGIAVYFECRDRLRRLFSTIDGIDQLVDSGKAQSGFDYVLAMMSLPAVFETDFDTIPPPTRFFVPDETRSKVRPLFEFAKERFKVGILWSGSVSNQANAKRSVKLERFLDLATVPGVQLYSLYKGALQRQLTECGGNTVIIDACSGDQDFLDTAAVIEQLDLVISTDSATVHLAASLGCPTWNLLPFSPHWYWLHWTVGESTPWYADMRLFRQPAVGDWDSVFAAVQRELSDAVAAKRAGRWPRPAR